MESKRVRGPTSEAQLVLVAQSLKQFLNPVTQSWSGQYQQLMISDQPAGRFESG
jgi:hypothetical protein